MPNLLRLAAPLGAALLVGAVLWFSWPPEQQPETQPPQAANKDEARANPIVILGWIPYWDQAKAFASFKANVDLFNYISLFWYRLDSRGQLRPYSQTKEDENIIAFAHQNGVKVLAVIANLPDYAEGGDWDWQRVERVISSAEARRRHVADLAALAEGENFDGINIDYEALRRSQREDFTAFIRELADALHARGKILGVALHPKTGEFKPSEDNGSPAQDWNAIAQYADHLYLMTYSQHSLASEPGPNASPAWMDRVLEYAVNVRKIPKEKLFMGIPFYGHEWVETRPGQWEGIDDDVTFAHAAELAEQYGVPIQWDEDAMTPFSTFRRRGRQHSVWFENKKSLESKLELRKKYQIPNIAFWRLGGEDPEVWNTLRAPAE